jgi:DNA-binding phage protein
MARKYYSKSVETVDELKDLHPSLDYLNSLINDHDDLLFALKAVIMARTSFFELSELINVGHASLYKTLSPDQSPRFESILKIIHGLGFSLKLELFNNKSISGKRYVRNYSLAYYSSTLSLLWDPIKNGKLTPNDVLVGSKKMVHWKCLKYPEHEWSESVNSMVKNKTFQCKFGCK